MHPRRNRELRRRERDEQARRQLAARRCGRGAGRGDERGRQGRGGGGRGERGRRQGRARVRCAACGRHAGAGVQFALQAQQARDLDRGGRRGRGANRAPARLAPPFLSHLGHPFKVGRPAVLGLVAVQQAVQQSGFQGEGRGGEPVLRRRAEGGGRRQRRAGAVPGEHAAAVARTARSASPMVAAAAAGGVPRWEWGRARAARGPPAPPLSPRFAAPPLSNPSFGRRHAEQDLAAR